MVLSPNKILLFHRDNIPSIPFPDCWHLVGGGIEEGESPEQAIRREMSEEVSYVPEKIDYLAKIKGTLGEDVYLFVCFIKKEEEKLFVHNPGEGQEIGFFTIEEALKLKMTPKTKELITWLSGKLAAGGGNALTERSAKRKIKMVLMEPGNKTIDDRSRAGGKTADDRIKRN